MYYDVSTEEPLRRPDAPGADVDTIEEEEPPNQANLPDELDNLRVKNEAEHTGTFRSREGSNDRAMPANKALFILDHSPGTFV